MCLNDNYSSFRVGKHLSDTFPIRNGLKHEGTVSPLLFNFPLECTIKRVQVNQDSLKLNGIRQFLVDVNDVNILERSVHSITKNAEALVVAMTGTGLEINAVKTK